MNKKFALAAVLAALVATSDHARAQVSRSDSGAAVSTVSVASATAGTQVVSSIARGVTVTLPSTAAVPVWVARLHGTCATAMTAKRGVRITAGNGYEYTFDEHWGGQLCAILESGVTAVSVEVNTW
jgi:hypothetical protein